MSSPTGPTRMLVPDLPVFLLLLQTGFAKRLTLVSLAGRGSGLCINESVAALGNTALITERCTELQVGSCTVDSWYVTH